MIYTGLAGAAEGQTNDSVAVTGVATTVSEHDAINAKFLQHDPKGIGMTLIAMSVVFLGLILLSVVFQLLGHLNTAKKPLLGGAGHSSKEGSSQEDQDAVVAAIGLALYEYESSLRDDEIISLTIKEISRRYSPWSSKIYGVHNNRLRR